MKSNKLRLVSLVLSLLMLLSMAVAMIACNEETPNQNNNGSNNNSSNDQVNNGTTKPDDPYAGYQIPDSLPERNFSQEGMREFIIACQDAMVDFFWVEVARIFFFFLLVLIRIAALFELVLSS